MHVLCAPPAFILSQDQTLILFDKNKLRSAVSDFSKFFLDIHTYNLEKISSSSLHNSFLLVNLSFRFYNQIHSSFLTLFLTLSRFSFLVVLLPLYWFLKVYCLLFNVLFMFSIDLVDDKKYFSINQIIMSILFLNFFKIFLMVFIQLISCIFLSHFKTCFCL